MLSTASPFASTAHSLFAMGYTPLPIRPGTQVPGEQVQGGQAYMGMEKWSSREVAQADIDRWSGMPAAGVCVRTGANGGEWQLLAVDADQDGTVDEVFSLIPYSPVQKVGSKGRTAFYKAKGIASTFCNDATGERVVDILSDGRQTILPPTIHAKTGNEYRWAGEYPLSEIEIADLPELTQLDIDTLEKRWPNKAGKTGTVTRAAGKAKEVELGAGDAPHRQLNDHALANLGMWVPGLDLYRCKDSGRGGFEAVATWRPSSGGRPKAVRKRNLQIHPDGIVDFGDGPRNFTPLDLVMQALGMDLDDAFTWLSRATKWVAATEVPIREVTIEEAKAEAKAAIEQEAPAKPVEPVVEFKEPEPQESPEIAPEGHPLTKAGYDALSIPGLVGEIVRYCYKTSLYPYPDAFVALALTIVGTLMGRRFQTPNELSTVLYATHVAPPSSGKGHALKVGAQLLYHARMEKLMAPTQINSGPYIADEIWKSPVSLSLIDEIGSMLALINQERAPEYLAQISMVMRQQWSEWKWGTFGSKASPSKPVILSNWSVYGGSTPEQFFDALVGGATSNGFFSRWLVIYTPDFAPEKEKESDGVAAAKIVDEIQLRMSKISGLQATALYNSSIVPTVKPLQWQTVDRSKPLRLKNREMCAISKLNAMTMPRIPDMTERVATIISWGRNAEQTVVMDEDWDFAESWVNDRFMEVNAILQENAHEQVDVKNFGALKRAVLDEMMMNGGMATQRDINRGPLRNCNNKQAEMVMQKLHLGDELIEPVKVAGKTYWKYVGKGPQL